MKRTFPDLHVKNRSHRQPVHEGDWTATATELSGTRQGDLTLPRCIASKSVAPTGTKFKLALHYRKMADWANGWIAGEHGSLRSVASLGIALEDNTTGLWDYN